MKQINIRRTALERLRGLTRSRQEYISSSVVAKFGFSHKSVGVRLRLV